MSKEIIYTMKGVGKTVQPNKTILKDIYLSYFYGAKIGVLGLNGAGKSTLLRIMAGVDKDFIGEAFPSRKMKVGYLAQEPQLDEELTVRENVEQGFGELKPLLDEFNEISQKFAEEMTPEEMEKLIERQGVVQEQIEAMDGWEIDRKVEMAMQALHCPPSEKIVKNLSGGEKRRVALCRLLLSNPDILLLDEPTNHLDAESVAWLEKFLATFPGTVIAVTHDRFFLDNVAGWILELDRGHGIPWEGNYSSWLEQKEERLRQEQKSEEKKFKTLQRELEWIRMAPKARHSKSKARISNYEKMLKEPSRESLQEMQIYIPPGPRLGDTVVRAENLSKSYDGRTLYSNLSFEIPKGGILGIIGPNGTGKTTLFNMIAGRENPDDGKIDVGQTVKLAYVDQTRETLDPNKTVWEDISAGEEVLYLGNRDMNSRAYVSRFNFSGSDQQKKVGTLSGGERNRVNMAKMFLEGANLLLLDEPTNDLDVNTMRALEEAILEFGGSVAVISHDRWFLDRIATHILAFDGNGKVEFFHGNYSEYERHKESTGENTSQVGSEATI